ncbi:laminarinase [Coprinellus micaceus]|uniref:Laminarinase n=1 Tax=Coprinellus micaceus TaxID=71717 RepID=A0A4Y7SRP5_COPMI|nr:laminarinase [Coprinellus micaceus]
MRSTTVFTFLSLVSASLAGTYNRRLRTVGEGFYEDFTFEAIPDPTHGRVNYVNRETAERFNLTFGGGETFILRSDHDTPLDPAGPGRSSVRLKSVMQYVNHVAVFDIRHMPEGCGTWPAVWEVGDNWPHGGEIDILEGVNDKGPNAVTLHTNEGCMMHRDRQGQRTDSVVVEENCDVAAKGNVGCPTRLGDAKSYGTPFNANGGGHYAVERSPQFIKVWFWPRGDPALPEDAAKGAKVVNTDAWGEPAAFFPANSCNIDEKFGPQNIIINLTFCGDWAGSVFNQDGCLGDCIAHVNGNPSAFQNAFFDFASISTYLP